MAQGPAWGEIAGVQASSGEDQPDHTRSVRIACRAVGASRVSGIVQLLRLVACVACVVPAMHLSAQGASRCDATDRVRRMEFSGSEIRTDEIATVLSTQEPGFLNRVFHLGSAPCMDSLEVERDALRIAVLHRQRGWFQASVTPTVTHQENGATIRFEVTPGPQAIIHDVTLTGLPDSASRVSESLSTPLEEMQGRVFDRVRVQAATDEIVTRLKDAGFARARAPTTTVQIDSAAAQVDLTFAFDAGAPLRIGAIAVDVTPVARRDIRLDSGDVVRLADLELGVLYRATDVLIAERKLYATDAFRLVLIDTVTPPPERSDSTIDLLVTVAEARTRSARVGAGWGTLECGRVQGRVTDRGFLGPGRRVELVARASRLGIGAPLDQLPGLCPQFLREDPYSQELNYYLGVTLSNNALFGWQVAPSINIYSERRGEYNAFQRETDIGVSVALSKSFGRRVSTGASAEYESGRTVTDAILACVRFALCQPADFALARQGNITRALNATWVYDRVGNTADPRYGGRLRVDARIGNTQFRGLEALGDAFGRAYGFYRPTVEASGFTRFAAGTVAARVQWSQVYAPNAFRVSGVPFLPPQERLFSGGQSTVRGYQQNLLGPVVYRVSRASVDSVPFGDSYQLVVKPDAAVGTPSPEGGTGTLVGNLEYRRRFGWPSRDLQWVAFLDAGTVWATGIAAFSVTEVRATPGLGVRLDTPLGPFRVDIGYNPRRADPGKAFLFDNLQTSASGAATPNVICVSPGQQLTFDEQLEAGGFACPRNFTPSSSRSLLSRLVFHFSLGQAF